MKYFWTQFYKIWTEGPFLDKFYFGNDPLEMVSREKWYLFSKMVENVSLFQKV